MFKNIIFIFTLTLLNFSYAASITVASYNCGGIRDHYDYLRAVSLQQLIQERYNKEPLILAEYARAQETKLIELFAPIGLSHQQHILNYKVYGHVIELNHIVQHPYKENSINKKWREKSEKIITTHLIRPIVIYDHTTQDLLNRHIRDTLKANEVDETHLSLNEKLDIVRSIMAEDIFANHMTYDVIALQEADYLYQELFPENYSIEFSDQTNNLNAIAWDTTKLKLVEKVDQISNRHFSLVLEHIETGKTLLVTSAHLTGCNPFEIEYNDKGIADSLKGDDQLAQAVTQMGSIEADIKVIAMDSNVTAMHPRMRLLKNLGYMIDYTNYLYPTCTSPWQILDTRIDWIAVDNLMPLKTKIVNIPIHNVGLNSITTNISDHKPVASRIDF